MSLLHKFAKTPPIRKCIGCGSMFSPTKQADFRCPVCLEPSAVDRVADEPAGYWARRAPRRDRRVILPIGEVEHFFHSDPRHKAK